MRIETKDVVAVADAPVRVGIVEDHLRYRAVLRAVIEQINGLHAVWEAADGRTALQLLEATPIDLAIVDLSLPEMNGIDVLTAFRRHQPGLSCVIVSGHTEHVYVERSLRAGAAAYVLKGRPADLRDGIAAAVAGGRYLSPRLGPLDPSG